MNTRRFLFIATLALAAPLAAQEAATTPLRTFQGHSSSVLSVAFCPDGRYLATGSDDGPAKLWEVSTGREIHNFQGHNDAVKSVSFSPDGLLLATASRDSTAKLWEVSTGRLVRTFKGHENRVMSVFFFPDGSLLATGSWDNTAKLWEVSTGRVVRTFQGHDYAVLSVAFPPDGRYLATGSDDGTAKLWEVSTGREVRTFQGHDEIVLSVAFSPDGRQLVTGSGDNTAKLWEVASGRAVRTFQGHNEWVWSVAFSPDGRHLATGSSDKTAKLWEIPDEVISLLAEINVETVSPLTGDVSSMPSIAILDFNGIGVSAQETQVLTNRVGTHFVQLGRHQVIERGEMEQILQEQDFQLTGCTTNECAVEIGQLIGAQQILAGSFGKLGTVYTIDMKIIDVETGRVLRTASYDSEGSINLLLTEGLAVAVRRIAGME